MEEIVQAPESTRIEEGADKAQRLLSVEIREFPPTHPSPRIILHLALSDAHPPIFTGPGVVEEPIRIPGIQEPVLVSPTAQVSKTQSKLAQLRGRFGLPKEEQ